jgi:hypothetical protein
MCSGIETPFTVEQHVCIRVCGSGSRQGAKTLQKKSIQISTRASFMNHGSLSHVLCKLAFPFTGPASVLLDDWHRKFVFFAAKTNAARKRDTAKFDPSA